MFTSSSFSIIIPLIISSSAFIAPTSYFARHEFGNGSRHTKFSRDHSSILPLPFTSSPQSLRMGSDGGLEGSVETDTVTNTVILEEGTLSSNTKPPTNQFQEYVTKNIFLGIEPSVEIIAIMTIYFVEGGLGLARLAQTFYLKDTLHLGPAELSAFTGIFTLPWTIKPIYGLLSDAVPLFGYRRRSYLILCGCIGCLSYLALGGGFFGLLDGFNVDGGEDGSDILLRFTIASFILGSACIAFCDVVADGIVVQRTREAIDAVAGSEGGREKGDASAVAGGLQSLCWGSAAVGGLISSYFSGSLLEIMGPEEVFRLTAILPLAVAVTASFIDEVPVSTNDAKDGNEITDEPTMLSQLSSLRDAITLPSVWKPTLFLLLWRATPTSDGAFLFFMTDDLHMGPELLGRVRFVTSLASFVGVWGYQKYLRTTPVKDILFWTTIASAPLGLIQLLLVTHTNQLLGIPDSYLIYGDDVVLAVLGQFAFLPTLVLAASICPPGVEAVLFACLMSVFNGAGVLGTEVGAYLTKFLGISGGDGGDGFDNLGLLIVLCNVSSLLPLAFIGLLDDATSTGNDEDNGGINNDVVDEVEIVEDFS